MRTTPLDAAGRLRRVTSWTMLLLALGLSGIGHAEDLKPDADGYVRHWVMLAPIPLPEGEPGGDAVLRDQIKDEAALRPSAGDRVRIGGKDLAWQNVTTPTNHLDFNALLKTANDHAAGYMVTYVECDAEMPGVIVAVGSNDQGRIYFNGVDIYAFTEARPLVLDADKGRVTLKKGLNTFVFKIINEQNSWQGALRLLDKSGRPLGNIRIRLSP